MDIQNFIRLRAVERMTGLPRSSIYDKIAKGTFPKPVKLGAKAVAWLETEIAEWQQQRIAARDGETEAA